MKSRTITLASLTFGLFALAGCATTQIPDNLGGAKQQVQKFCKSGSAVVYTSKFADRIIPPARAWDGGTCKN